LIPHPGSNLIIARWYILVIAYPDYKSLATGFCILLQSFRLPFFLWHAIMEYFEKYSPAMNTLRYMTFNSHR
jgi:hypothetical protein